MIVARTDRMSRQRAARPPPSPLVRARSSARASADGKGLSSPGARRAPSVKPARSGARRRGRPGRVRAVRADMAGSILGRRHFCAEKGAAVFEDLDGELNDHFLGAFLGVPNRRAAARTAPGVA